MIFHYLSLPIAVIIAATIIRDLMNKKKHNVNIRIALILVCLAAFWVSGLAIDWVKSQYQQTHGSYKVIDQNTSVPK